MINIQNTIAIMRLQVKALERKDKRNEITPEELNELACMHVLLESFEEYQKEIES